MEHQIAILTNTRRRRPRRKLRRATPPRMDRHESRYAARVNAIAESVQENILEELLPELEGIVAERQAEIVVVPALILDDSTNRIGRVFGQITVFAEAQLPEARLRNAAERTAGEVNQTNQDFNREEVRTLLGVDVLTPEPWLLPEIEAFTNENVKLIKDVTAGQVSDIEQLVIRMVRAGDGPRAIRDAVDVVMRDTRQRAQLIARDQIGKFNGVLTKRRQAALGIDRYTWRTAEDERVRATHRRLDGTVHLWSEGEGQGPVTVLTGKRAGERNHPGQDIQCRCNAEAIFPDEVRRSGGR